MTLSLCCSETGTSADLEVTVALLVQIDKLVQLIESPVFTCEFLPWRTVRLGLTWNPNFRPETPTSRAGEISVPFQVFVWPIDAVATKFGVCLFEKQAQRSKLLRIFAHCTEIDVRSTLSMTQASNELSDAGPWGIFHPLDRNWVGKRLSGKNSSSTFVLSRPSTRKQGDKLLGQIPPRSLNSWQMTETRPARVPHRLPPLGSEQARTRGVAVSGGKK